FVVLYFRGLACIFNRACTAACCPLPHLEAEQVIFLETVAFCPLPIERLSSSPEYWIWNKPLYLNPRSVSELFGPNPHMLAAPEARSVTHDKTVPATLQQRNERKVLISQ